MKKKFLIFDLDGTLIDSATDIVNSTNQTLMHFGHPALATNIIVAHIGEGLRKLVFDFFPESETNEKVRDEITDVFLKYYSDNLLQTTTVYPGVEDFLSTWPYPVGLVTNKPEKHTIETLDRLGLIRFKWSSIFAADSLSERKPHPLPLFESIKRANVTPDETLMIGDGVPDMVAAQRAQVQSVACLYGYSASETLMSFQPVGYLRAFSELPSLVESL